MADWVIVEKAKDFYKNLNISEPCSFLMVGHETLNHLFNFEINRSYFGVLIYTLLVHYTVILFLFHLPNSFRPIIQLFQLSNPPKVPCWLDNRTCTVQYLYCIHLKINTYGDAE